MKMEDKILELLAEYLKKTDQTLERIEETNKRIEETNKRIDQSNKRMDLAYGILVQHSEELISLRKEARQEALKREVQQEALLKEIFSISKRVGNLENKNT
jgi:superoxide dismutase